MKILGLTGGIGSGKSVVAELLQIMGIPVYDSDARSKNLCNTDERLIKSISNLFGPELYKDGLLDGKLLADHIFGDETALKAINALIHPVVVRDFMEWCKLNCQYPILVMESAIIFEAGLEHLFDRIITITAPEETRIERVCKRNGISSESVKARLKNQISESERVSKSDFIIVNDDVQAVLPQVIKIVHSLSL